MRSLKFVALGLLGILALVLFNGSKEGIQNSTTIGEICSSLTMLSNKCPDNRSLDKVDEAGSNCFGWCPYSNTYKNNKEGSNCIMYPFGYCKEVPTRPKLDEEGSNCVDGTYDYKLCSDNDALKSSEGGTNCFGWCPTSANQQRKVYKWPWEQCPPL